MAVWCTASYATSVAWYSCQVWGDLLLLVQGTNSYRLNRWDDWVSGDRVRKYTEENKELAQNLKKDLDAQRKPALLKTTSKKKAGSSDRSSNRASEERHSSVPATSRGQKRTRDEVDKVSDISCSPLSHFTHAFACQTSR